MIDHISLPVRDLVAAVAFYEATLAPLGYARLVEREAAVGFSKRYPEVWLNARPVACARDDHDGGHLCLRARDEEAVRRSHAAGVAQGAADDGGPGSRAAALTGYYAAFIRDLDGNRLEAATFPKDPI